MMPDNPLNDLENPMVMGEYYPDPDAVCESCGAWLLDNTNKTAREQKSASGKYCEQCIVRYCDTVATRALWMQEEDLRCDFIDYLKEQEQFQLLQGYEDELLQEFIDTEYESEYFLWLMATN